MIRAFILRWHINANYFLIAKIVVSLKIQWNVQKDPFYLIEVLYIYCIYIPGIEFRF